MCARATRILAMATIRERQLFIFTHLEVRFLFESATNRERRLIERIRYLSVWPLKAITWRAIAAVDVASSSATSLMDQTAPLPNAGCITLPASPCH